MKGKPQIGLRAGVAEVDVSEQRVVRSTGGATPPPLTTAPSSVFSMAGAGQKASGKRNVLDLAKVVIKKGVPIPPAQTGARSLYATLWASMSIGDMAELSDKQAACLVAYANKAKGRVETRRLGVGVKGVWRTA